MKLKDSVIIILGVIIAIVLGVFVGVEITENKYDNKQSDKVETDNKESESSNNSDSNNKIDVSKQNWMVHNVELNGISLYSRFGEIIVTTDGDVYYVPGGNVNDFGEINELKFRNENNIGIKKNYTVKGYNEAWGDNGTESMPFEAYKLNITNIQAAYNVHFGNGGGRGTVILVGKDGNISEFAVYEDWDNAGYYEMVLFKNIEGYSNIVSVVPSTRTGGSYAILIDKSGNYYDYYGSEANS